MWHRRLLAAIVVASFVATGLAWGQGKAPPTSNSSSGRLVELGRGFVVIDAKNGPQRHPLTPDAEIVVYGMMKFSELPLGATVVLDGRVRDPDVASEVGYQVHYYPRGVGKEMFTNGSYHAVLPCVYYDDTKQWTVRLIGTVTRENPLTVQVSKGHRYQRNAAGTPMQGTFFDGRSIELSATGSRGQPDRARVFFDRDAPMVNASVHVSSSKVSSKGVIDRVIVTRTDAFEIPQPQSPSNSKGGVKLELPGKK